MTDASVIEEARSCSLCQDLPLGPRPVFQIHPAAKILIIGQAPGTKAHEANRPFMDQSGKRLRDWLGVDEATFYDPSKIAFMPMGFCYPGRLPRGGDVPPRAICAPTWHPRMLAMMGEVGMTFLVGTYALQRYLGERIKGRKLADIVEDWRSFVPEFIPAPHPSPRNTMWLKRYPIFEAEVLPYVRMRVDELIG